METDKFAVMLSEIDEQIGQLILKHQIDPLSFAAIILARMGLLMKEMGGKDDYIRLLFDVGHRIMDESKDEKVIH
jgi:hypothetical protein